MEKLALLLIDFLIPRFCPSCKSKLDSYSPPVCKECLRKINRPDPGRLKLEYNRKFAQSGIISDFTSHFVFEKGKELQDIIHSMKYGKKFLLGVFLGSLLGKTINKNFKGYSIDTVVPVPLHSLKKAEREYNQSLFIAKGVSRVTGIKINSRLITRKQYTESQTAMNLSERDENIRGAFAARKSLKGANILIVDDIITTGSTILECGKVLLETGADKIYAASVAIAD
jgi:ComF family protein